MPLLADIYSTADAFKRNLKDIAQNPLAVADRQVRALRNAQLGQEAVINDQGAGMREIPREEQYRRAIEGSLDTVGGGLGGVIKPVGGTFGSISSYSPIVAALSKHEPRNIGVEIEKRLMGGESVDVGGMRFHPFSPNDKYKTIPISRGENPDVGYIGTINNADQPGSIRDEIVRILAEDPSLMPEFQRTMLKSVK